MALKVSLRAADEVWIATALLHYANPTAEDFSREDILEKVLSKFGSSHSHSAISTHISTHCVANTKPNPLSQNHRMLFRTERGRYRLYRPSDVSDPQRVKGDIKPQTKGIPEYHYLLQWYDDIYAHPMEVKVFTLDALLLKVKPGNSGLTDVSVNHDKYLAQAAWEEFHAAPSRQTH